MSDLNKDKQIETVADQVRQFLFRRCSEVRNSIAGEQPDEEYRYSNYYYQCKDELEILNRFITILDSLKPSDFIDVTAFFDAYTDVLQNFPREYYHKLFFYMEKTLKHSIKPRKGPSTHYLSWVKHYSNEYGISPGILQSLIPYESFENMDSSKRIAILEANRNRSS